MVIIHGKNPLAMSGIVLNIIEKKVSIVQAKPPGAFDAARLPAGAGQAYGAYRGLNICSHAAPLSNCWRIVHGCFREVFLNILSAFGSRNLRAIISGLTLPTHNQSHGCAAGQEVERFDRPPAVAESPLLAPLTKKLVAHPLDDTRRFAGA